MRDYCRLCACKNYNNLCLFGANDDPNEIYKAVELYFTSVFLNLTWAKPFRWICHQCCKCIMEFKMFQEFVGKSQKKLMAVAEAKQSKRKRKANIRNDKPLEANVINSQHVETLPQGFNNDPTNIPTADVCSMPCKIAEPSTTMPVTYNKDYPTDAITSQLPANVAPDKNQYSGDTLANNTIRHENETSYSINEDNINTGCGDNKYIILNDNSLEESPNPQCHTPHNLENHTSFPANLKSENNYDPEFLPLEAEPNYQEFKSESPNNSQILPNSLKTETDLSALSSLSSSILNAGTESHYNHYVVAEPYFVTSDNNAESTEKALHTSGFSNSISTTNILHYDDIDDEEEEEEEPIGILIEMEEETKCVPQKSLYEQLKAHRIKKFRNIDTSQKYVNLLHNYHAHI